MKRDSGELLSLAYFSLKNRIKIVSLISIILSCLQGLQSFCFSSYTTEMKETLDSTCVQQEPCPLNVLFFILPLVNVDLVRLIGLKWHLSLAFINIQGASLQ